MKVNNESTRRRMIDASTRHQVYLQRFAGTQTKQLLLYFKQLEAEAKRLLKPEATVLTKLRYIKIINALQDLSKALKRDMVNNVKGNLKELAKYEADFTKRLLDNSINTKKVPFETAVPATRQLTTAAFDNIMDSSVPKMGLTGGVKVADALSGFGSKVASEVIRKVRDGYSLGQTTQEITKGINDYVGSALTRSQSHSIARTITNHVASSSRYEFYQENIDIITGYQVVATLDGSTTLTCASLDGQVFDADDFDRPPYHWGCRTTFIGVVDPKYSISFSDSTRPAKGNEGVEAIESQTTYDKWLRTQPISFQNDVLGVTRAEAFRNGEKLQSFVDHNYSPLTIDQLKKKDII